LRPYSTAFACLSTSIPGGCLAALAATPWTAHSCSRNYEDDWSVIALRAPKGAQHPIQMILSNPGVSDYVDTLFLAHAPYFQAALAEFKGPLLAVRLMRLGAGSVIKEHSDHDLSFEEGTVRQHIPVATNDEFDLRLSNVHSVANRGRSDRCTW
jgi:hypothetical protein